MRARNGKLSFAPTDLSRFLACRHLTSLERSVKLGETSPPPVFEDPRRDALAEAGREHETRMLERYRIEGHTIETIGASGGFAERNERTLDAMRRGTEVIHQGRLGRGKWGGYPDFLVRIPRPSGLGDWSYEVVDAKLATVAKADAVLQIAVYSWLLERAQGTAPVEMHLALGGAGDMEPFRVADFAAFERALRRQFEDHCADPGRPIRSRWISVRAATGTRHAVIGDARMTTSRWLPGLPDTSASVWKTAASRLWRRWAGSPFPWTRRSTACNPSR